jgi:hypothetical protein
MKRTDSRAEVLADIAGALDRLCQELTVVREVLDEIRDELQWANRNRHAEVWSAVPSQNREPQQADTAAPDDVERRRRRSAATLPADADAEGVAPTQPPGQLF